MARTRSIKPSFFSNDILAECEPMARLLFAGLWTLADRDGRLEYRPRRIKGALFPYDNCDIDGLVAQLVARGFVTVYRANGIDVLAIPTFGEHQRCHPDERSEGLPAPEDASENPVIPGRNAKPGNFPADAPDFPANCACIPSSCIPSSSSPSVLSTPSEPPKRRRSPSAAIAWSADAGWQGITPEDRQEWAMAYPGAVIDQELAKATAWLKANPKRAGTRNWRKFLVGWLSRCQDKGGTNREVGNRPQPQDGRRTADEAAQAWDRRVADPERHRRMQEFKAAKEARREAAKLAAALKIPEDA